MKTITIQVDEDVAEWARVHAARQGSCASKIVGEMLREHMRNEEGYDAARRSLLSRKPTRLKDENDSYPSRDDIHER